MPPQRQFSRVDTLDLKLQIIKKLGRQKSEKYFFNLRRLLNLKLSKMEFDKFCFTIMGKENVRLHNLFIRSILSNACFSHGPPSRHAATGNSLSTITSNGQFSDILPVSPRKGRSITSRDRRLNDRPSPLGPHGKMASGTVMEVTNSCDVQRSREQQSAPELISIGSKALLEVLSVEDGEEVEQVRGSPSVQSRSPIRAPFGITFSSKGLNGRTLPTGYASLLHLAKSDVSECCRISSMLPDMMSLRKRLECKLETEGLDLSVDCINLLNHGLDVYLKKMIKPCLELARSRYGNSNLRNSSQYYSASMADFKVAMQSSPRLLGVDWPVQLEKICIYSLEE